MNKWNVLNGIAVVAVGILLPQVTRAEYVGPYNSPGFGASLSQASALLAQPTSLLTGTNAGDSLSDIAEKSRADAQALLDKVAKTAKLEEDERKNNKWLNDYNQRIENAQKVRDAFEIDGLKKSKEAVDKNKAAIAKNAQIGTARGVSPQDIDTTDLGKICGNGVDFKPFKKRTDSLGSDPFSYFKSNYAKMLESKSEDAKKNFLATLKKLNAKFEERENQEPTDFQTNIQNAGADLLAKGEKGEFVKEKRLAEQRKQLAAKKLAAKDAESLLRKDLFTKLLPGAFENNANKADFDQLKANFVKTLKDTLAVTQQEAFASARQLEVNCNKEKAHIGNDVVAMGNTSTLTSELFTVLGSSPKFANSQNQRLQSFSTYRNLQCRNASSQLDSLYGESSALNTKANNLDNFTKPEDFIGGVNDVLAELTNTNGQVGGILKPAIDSCKKVEAESVALSKDIEGAKAIVGQATAADQSATQTAQAGPQPRSANSQVAKGGQFSNSPRRGRAIHSL